MHASARARATIAAVPVARHGRLSARRAPGAVARFAAVAIAVVLVSSLSVAAFAVYDIASGIAPGVALAGEDDASAPQIGAIEGEANLLLVGSDSGGGDTSFGVREGERNDVTMLMHIAKDHQSATVVSFPRDLFVDVPACTSEDGETFPAATDQKMNTTLARGGLACPVATVEKLTGLDIPFAAKIEFNGVIAMSNAIGGVQVCVATAIHDRQNDFDLEAGQSTIQGRDAFLFLQSRYGVGDGSDITRISNQQQFLSSLVRKLKSSETLSNPLKLYGIASAASQNLEFSNSLRNVDTMVSIAGALKDIPLENVLFVTYPGVADMRGVIGNDEAAQALFAAIKADQPLALTGGTGGGTELDAAAAPTDPPSPPADPSATPDPGAPLASPSAPARVELPDAVSGQNASQQTCTRGQTAGGHSG